MSNNELPTTLQLKPIISYPREAQVSKTYLVSIDVQLATPNASWDFPEEEYTIGFILNTSPYFTCKPLHNVWPTIILHRYGGTYGPAEFLFTAAEHEIERGQISITLVNGWGIPMTRLELPCEVNLESELHRRLPEIALPYEQDTSKTNRQPPPQVSQEEQEERQRIERIAAMLINAGWAVVNMTDAVAPQSTGIAIRMYPSVEIKRSDGSIYSTMMYDTVGFLLVSNYEAVGTIVKEEVPLIMTASELVDALINRPGNMLWSSLIRTRRDPLPFIYEMQGEEIHFTNNLEPDARTRIVFHFHRPETFALWLEQAPVGTPNDLNNLLRSQLRRMPPVSETNLSISQFEAITKLEASFAQNRPRALLQMTDSTPIILSSINRLLEYGGAKHVLYLVNSLEDQNALEQYLISDPDHPFMHSQILNAIAFSLKTSELWIIKSSSNDLSNIYITNIDYIYRLLARTHSEAYRPDDAAQVDASIEYQSEYPIDLFDVIFFVECFDKLRQQYRPLLDYFDAFLVGVGDYISSQVAALFNRNIAHESELRNSIFICFSWEDKEFLERLEIHFKGYRYMDNLPLNINIWGRMSVTAGTSWSYAFEQNLQITKVAVLLVSADFLASDEIRNFELPLLLQSANQGKVTIIPIIIKPCLLTYTPLAQFQPFNNFNEPLASLPLIQQDEIWVNVARSTLNTIGIKSNIRPIPIESLQNEFVETSWQAASQGIADISRHRIFISYSHEDGAYFERLRAHLMGYRYRSNTSLDIDIWDEEKLQQEADWHEEFQKSLQLTRIAILLISPNFMASDYIIGVELPLLLQAASRGEIIIMPIIVRSCLLDHTPFAQMQTFNNPTTPVSIMTQGRQEEIWTNVAETVWKVINVNIPPEEEKRNEVDEAVPKTIDREIVDIEPHRILVSYNHRDQAHLERLRTHLIGYKYISSTSLDIDIWDVIKIQQEVDWQEEFQKSLQASRIVILLISADFLASDSIREFELPLFLQAASQRNITILPVIVSPCAYIQTPFAQFPSFNNPSIPLNAMLPTQQEQTWAEVAETAWKAISA